MMTQRKIFLLTLTAAFVCIIIIAAFSFVMSKLKFDSDALLTSINDREYNSVIAKKLPYDAAIFGSSMSQGFKCSEFDSGFDCQSLKLTFSGANLAEIKFMTDYAFRFRKLKCAMIDCNLLTFTMTPELIKIPLKAYGEDLYKSRFEKSFSINTFFDGIDFLTDYLSGEVKTVTRDELYDWNLERASGEKYLAREILYKAKPQPELNEEYIRTACGNVKEYLLPILEAHPETEFILFYPPYCMMIYREVDPAAYIRYKRELSDMLLSYGNVRLYDFQTAFSVTENFENYKDLLHYSGTVSSWIIGELKQDDYRMTAENKELFLQNLQQKLETFPYQKEYERLKSRYSK